MAIGQTKSAQKSLLKGKHLPKSCGSPYEGIVSSSKTPHGLERAPRGFRPPNAPLRQDKRCGKNCGAVCSGSAGSGVGRGKWKTKGNQMF